MDDRSHSSSVDASTSPLTPEDPLLNDPATPPDPAASDTTADTDPNGASAEHPEADARIEELEERIQALETERDTLNDQFLRKAAELENTRRRLTEQANKKYDAGKVEAIQEVLSIIDDLQRSLDAATQFEESDDPKSAYETLRDGLTLVHSNFLSALKEVGVEPIEAEGEPFDEQKHDAMMQQPAPEGVEPGTVLKEVRRGYRMGDRVVRHAQVVVAS